MDKYEFNIKIEQIKKLIDEGDFATAMKIADVIDWSRVRNTNLLSMAAEVYEKNGEIQEAKDKLLLAFERAPIGKRLLYKLTELSVKSGDIEEAEDYYHEFSDLAPDDLRACLLAYMILKARGAAAKDLIEPLERYTAVDPDDRWLYELAEVYAQAGRPADCVRVCDRIALLFGAGVYSEQALRLKQRYTNLSAYQQEIVQNSYEDRQAVRSFGSGVELQNYAEEPYARENDAQETYTYEDPYMREAGAYLEGDLDEGAKAQSYEEPQETWSRNSQPLEEDRAGDILANQRYENEDAAFEAYVRLHQMEEEPARRPVSAHTKAGTAQVQAEPVRAGGTAGARAAEAVGEADADADTDAPGEQMPREPIGIDENELNDGFTDRLSEEVGRFSEEHAQDGGEQEEALGQTRILDEQSVERLRKVVILDDHFAEGPKVLAKDAEQAKAEAAKQAGAITEKLRKAAGTSGDVTAAGADDQAAVRETGAAGAVPLAAAATVATAAAATTTAAAGTIAARAIPQRPTLQARPSFTVTAEKKERGDDRTESRTSEQMQSRSLPRQEGADQDTVQKVRSDSRERAEKAAVSQRFHMIIEAETAEDGLAIAIDELKYIHKEYGITNAAAKTTAEKLNQKGLSPAAVERIKGKDFIIEHAGALNQKIAGQIESLIRTDRSGMIVVLIDVPEGLDRLEETCPQIFEHCDLVSDFEDEYDEAEDDAAYTEDEPAADAYEDTADAEAAYDEAGDRYHDDAYDAEPEESGIDDARENEADVDGDDDDDEAVETVSGQPKFHQSRAGKTASGSRKNSNVKAFVPANENEEMEIDDFAQYCCQFASEIDCSITGKSMLALYERIELMEEDNIPLTKKTAEELIEEAADRADKPPLGKRLKSLFSSKYDKNGLLILKEEDFIH